jgi:oligoribonuclease NrnB/cAMP/cGMP phosphodiesterase (DHH superfamily)
VLTPRRDGAFTVSVRAPKANPAKADELCRQFPTGGGRAAAAGINQLPPEQFDAFVARFNQIYMQQSAG